MCFQATLKEIINDPAPDVQASSPPIIWTNDSLISVEPLACLYGTALVLDAAIDPAVTLYDLVLYDNQGNLLGSWPGCGASPSTHQVIDLSTISNGGPYTGNSIQAAVTLYPPPPRNVQRQWLKFIQAVPYDSQYMEFAYGWQDPPFSSGDIQRAQMYQSGVVDVLFDPSRNNQYIPTPLNAYHTSAFHLYDNWSRQQFLADILNCGIVNLFYSGHGGDETIGSHVSDQDSLALVGADVLGADTMLANNLAHDGSWNNRNHPFRFVVLNCCDSAASDTWPIAFGFSPSINSLDDFTQRGMPPAAFLGWTKMINLPSTTIWIYNPFTQYEDALEEFTVLWMEEHSLWDCLDAATDPTWFYYPFDYHIKIVGTEQLTRSAYQP